MRDSQATSDPLVDLARHNAWATRELLAFCRAQDPSVLTVTAPGTYGNAIDTLRHMIDSEMSYLFRLTGAWETRPWPADEPMDLDLLTARAAILAEAFTAWIAAGNVDAERRGEARSDRGEVFSVPAGVFITQIFHHANLHRAHVCTQLSVQGIAVPDLSGWDYAMATGRSTLDRIEPVLKPD